MRTDHVETLRKYGDPLEKHAIDLVEEHLPQYATYWSVFVGNDGNNKPLYDTSSGSPDVKEKRLLVWEFLYSLFEATVLCHHVKSRFVEPVNAGDVEGLLTLKANYATWFALTGRVRDLASKALSEMGQGKSELFEEYMGHWKLLYLKRNQALHDKWPPLIQLDEYWLYAQRQSHSGPNAEFNDKQLWAEWSGDKTIDLGGVIANDLDQVLKLANSLFGHAVTIARDHLHYSQVIWPDDNSSQSRSKNTSTFPTSSITSPTMMLGSSGASNSKHGT